MNEIICYCKNISKSQIVDAIKNGAKNLKDIQQATTACTDNKCKEMNPKGRCCSIEIMQIFKEMDIQSNSKCECCK